MPIYRFIRETFVDGLIHKIGDRIVADTPPEHCVTESVFEDEVETVVIRTPRDSRFVSSSNEVARGWSTRAVDPKPAPGATERVGDSIRRTKY